ncbi:ATP-binding protein [Streptomyces sp. NPDC003077]|uniref:ATP-binding protein n=1 Tax=Streptomyces sp. NPDC003077 TaxID=3154443 RepID=UPI0033AD09EF
MTPPLDHNSPVVLRWNRHPGCVRKARAELSKALAEWGLGRIEDDALLVVSELLTNAICHARTAPGREIETRYVRTDCGVRIEVHDAAYERPQLLPEDPTRESGRGLLLVSVLADRWAVCDRRGIGKQVWAELSAPSVPGGRSGR